MKCTTRTKECSNIVFNRVWSSETMPKQIYKFEKKISERKKTHINSLFKDSEINLGGRLI